MASVIGAEHEKLGDWVYAYIVLLKAEIQVGEESPIRWS